MGYYYAALALFAITLWLMAVVERSKLGYYFRAIRDDQEGAEGIGIDSRLYKVIARSITAAVFAAAGVMQFTAMFSVASSLPSDFVSAITAAFAAL